MSIRRVPTRRRPPQHLHEVLLYLTRLLTLATDRSDMMPRHDKRPASCNVIPFPTPSRSVMFPEMPVRRQSAAGRDAALVDHDGRIYELGALIELRP